MEQLARASIALALFAPAPQPQTQLNAPLQRLTTGEVAPFVQSADGSRFAYVADERVDELYELFVVPSDGSAAPLLLSGALVAGGVTFPRKSGHPRWRELRQDVSHAETEPPLLHA